MLKKCQTRKVFPAVGSGFDGAAHMGIADRVAAGFDAAGIPFFEAVVSLYADAEIIPAVVIGEGHGHSGGGAGGQCCLRIMGAVSVVRDHDSTGFAVLAGQPQDSVAGKGNIGFAGGLVIELDLNGAITGISFEFAEEAVGTIYAQVVAAAFEFLQGPGVREGIAGLYGIGPGAGRFKLTRLIGMG